MRSQAKQPRANRTITVDFQNEATYFQLLGDGKAFLEFVFAFLLSLGFQLKHKATCATVQCVSRWPAMPSWLLTEVSVWHSVRSSIIIQKEASKHFSWGSHTCTTWCRISVGLSMPANVG